MRLGPRLCLTGSAFLFLILRIGPSALAAGGEQNPVEAPIGTLFRWLNFALVLGAIAYAMAKFVLPSLRRRAEAIFTSVREASAEKARAMNQLRGAEEKLARLDQDVAQLRAAAQRESAAEAERVRAATREDQEKIARAAQSEMEAAERAARLELKALAAQLAVERAGALIQKQMTERTQGALFRSFLDHLSRSAH